MWTIENTPLGQLNYYKQRTKTTCNIACGMMMLKALKGNQVDESTMIAAVIGYQSPAKQRLSPPGYTMKQVVDALSYKWGLSLHTRVLSPAILRQATANRPAICSVENTRFAHAVLIFGPTDYRSFLVLDPQFGIHVVPFDSFPVYPAAGLDKGVRFGSHIVTSW